MNFLVGLLLIILITTNSQNLEALELKSKKSDFVFQKTLKTNSICQTLDCKVHKGYIGISPGECFFVTRCSNCKRTTKLHSPASFCSTFSSFSEEITLFQGFLQLEDIVSKSDGNEDADSLLNSGDDKDNIYDSIEDSKDSEDFSKKDKGELDGEQEEVSSQIVNEDDESVNNMYSLNSLKSSFLQLHSDMSTNDSDFLEENETQKKPNKKYTNDSSKSKKVNNSKIPEFFRNILKKKKTRNRKSDKDNDNDIEDDVKVEKKKKKGSRGFPELNIFEGKKSKNKHIETKYKYENEGSIMRMGSKIEWFLKGEKFPSRINNCEVINNSVQLTVHTLIQFYSIEISNKENSFFTKRKYPSFEFKVDVQCKEDSKCIKPSQYMGKLTPNQKLLLSNTVSVPMDILSKNGLSTIIQGLKATYKCNSKLCYPNQYNSCVRITCSSNQNTLQQEKWKAKQESLNKERLNIMDSTVSKELQIFRDESTKAAEERKRILDQKSEFKKEIPKKDVEVIEEKVSYDNNYDIINKDERESKQDINNTTLVTQEFKQNSKNFNNNSNINKDEETNLSVEYQTIHEGEAIAPPTEEIRQQSLEQRLKRSLSIADTNIDEAEDQELHEKNQDDESLNQIEFNEVQPSIPIDRETDEPVVNKSNGKIIIFITIGIVTFLLILGGILCIM
ncbi:hypothetical protein cand_035930 [Cryptosporidium andersoni]|uniref:Uncharacterized protein n=1 Tax=Cryptosporidium andersoni TaxID=117008 RepID=A0A1J4MVK1_9CRYT|nr:hypothetical protein cand_035930 [Cryptosporidium andersoni]